MPPLKQNFLNLNPNARPNIIPPKRRYGFLPSRKIRYAIVFIIIIGLIIVFWPRIRSLWSENRAARNDIAILQNSPDRDTDQDGVPDWQEILVALDPRLPDTDGDGMGDREAFEARRASAKSANLDTTVFETSSTTDKLGLILAESIANLPTTATEADLEAVITENIAAYLESKKGEYAIYSKNSLTVTGNSDTEKKAYVAAITETFVGSGLDLRIVAEELQPSMVRKSPTAALEKQKRILASIQGKLAVMSVPSQPIELHLSLLNSIAILSGILGEIESINDSTEEAITVILVEKTATTIIETYDTFAKYLNMVAAP